MKTSKNQRIRSIIEHLGISVNAFAKQTNISQTTLSSMLNRGTEPKDALLESIANALPFIDRTWLFTGDGEMLRSVSSISTMDIKEGDSSGALVYDIDATCGTDNREIFFTQENIIGAVNLPGINKNSQIIRANGDSMEPKIYDGNMVVIREIKSWQDIFYGQMYLVLLDEYRMIKYIRRYEPDEEHYILLRSENAKYDDIKLRKDKIRKLFIVENILSVKTQL